VARQLASVWGVPPFELEAELFILLLQLANGLVHFMLNVVSDVMCVDDFIVS